MDTEPAFIPDDTPPSPHTAEQIPLRAQNQSSRSPSPQSDLDAPTLPDLPESPPPTQPQAQEEEEEIEDMPADGIVVLLRPHAEVVQVAPPTLLLDAMPNNSTQLPPVPALAPVSGNWSHFLTDTDVDFYSVTISPAALLRIYPPGCFVSLCSRSPEVRDLPMYKDWVFFCRTAVSVCI